MPLPELADLRRARSGENCPRCQKGALQQARGIEVGNIFKLGTKYSSAMQAPFTDSDGQSKPFVMGCYGIGITRTEQAAVEAAGMEAVLDDRGERAGVKFKDADLIGFPVRVTVGKGVSEGLVEVKSRDGYWQESLPIETIIPRIRTWLNGRLGLEA